MLIQQQSIWAKESATNSNPSLLGRGIGSSLSPCSGVTSFIAANPGELQHRKLAYWLRRRWGMNTSLLSALLDRPRSTIWGWLTQAERIPPSARTAILAELDELLLKN